MQLLVCTCSNVSTADSQSLCSTGHQALCTASCSVASTGCLLAVFCQPRELAYFPLHVDLSGCPPPPPHLARTTPLSDTRHCFRDFVCVYVGQGVQQVHGCSRCVGTWARGCVEGAADGAEGLKGTEDEDAMVRSSGKKSNAHCLTMGPKRRSSGNKTHFKYHACSK
jgi:hypothetical protein